MWSGWIVMMWVGVEDWLKWNKVKNYTINEDLSVDVDGDVNVIIISCRV